MFYLLPYSPFMSLPLLRRGTGRETRSGTADTCRGRDLLDLHATSQTRGYNLVGLARRMSGAQKKTRSTGPRMVPLSQSAFHLFYLGGPAASAVYSIEVTIGVLYSRKKAAPFSFNKIHGPWIHLVE